MRTSPGLSVTASVAIAWGVSSLFLIVLAGMALASGSATLPTVAVALLGLLINGACFMFITRRLVRPLGTAIADGRRLVKGDLTSGGGANAGGELGELHAIQRDLRDVLVNIVRDVRSGAISIDTTAMTLHEDNQALSQRSKVQAASIKETAASIDTLASTTAQSAETSERVSELVGTACDNAVKGNEVVQSVAATMDAIRTSSKKIADIVGVIDGIAFQTNILALNAAVEAARAGEQGRGFAVVASEVRHLAQRSAQEAKDIKALIGEAVKNVEEGSQLVTAAGQTMSEIVSSVGSVSGHMKEIATASREQSVSIQRINSAIVEFASMTAENQTLAATALSAAKNVTQYAGSLSESVAGFNLGSETGTADEAAELVRKAVAFAKENGLQALIDEVNKQGKGKFTYKDLYIGIYGFDSIIRAHGANRHFVGASSSATRDKTGKAFIADMIALGKSAGSGWVNYLFAHPITQEVKPKASYLERFEDAVITCGCYVSN